MSKIFILISCFVISVFVLFMGYDMIFKGRKYMNSFSKSPLDYALRQDMIKKNIWSPSCPVSMDRINLLKVSYVDFEGNEHHNGLLVVHDVAADHVLSIFKILYEKKFPINSVNLINEYNGNDEKSMEANNSSAFICRPIQSTGVISIHSYGLAVDINPQQNPYLLTKYEPGKTKVDIFPPQGMEFINRRNIRAGMVETILDDNSHDDVIHIFNKHGFSIWGGNWNDPIDWHHFQVTREQAETIAKLSYEEGLEFFNKLTESQAILTNNKE